MSESGLTPSRVQQQLPSALNGSGKKRRRVGSVTRPSSANGHSPFRRLDKGPATDTREYNATTIWEINKEGQ